MKIAYLIMAHRDPEQLERLIHAINYECRIFIHLDSRVKDDVFSKIKLPRNAEFISKRLKVYWGGFSMVQVTINLMEAAINCDEEFSHVVFLTGLDYPIQPIKRFHSLLTKNENRQFIRFINIEDSPEYYLKICKHYNFRDQWFPGDLILRKVLTQISIRQNVIQKKLLKNMKMAFGFANWAITMACAKHIMEFIEKNPKFVTYHKTLHNPDEHFFHTIIANSPFFSETEGFYEYKGRGNPYYTYLHVFRSVGPDREYGIHNFDEIKNSDKFFARKIISGKSLKLIEKINKELLKES